MTIRQNVFIFDAHPRQGEQLDIPILSGMQPFIYILDGELAIGELQIQKMEAVTDLENPIQTVTAVTDTTVVLFFVDMNAPVSLMGTISGKHD